MSPDRCALIQMGSSDQAQAAIQQLEGISTSQLMPAMTVRFPSPAVLAAGEEAKKRLEGAEETEEEEEEEDYYEEEAPEPVLAKRPLKERSKELGSRWKEKEDPNWNKALDGPSLWGWAMQPVEAKEHFPELPSTGFGEGEDSRVCQEDEGRQAEPAPIANWEEIAPDTEPSSFLRMRDAPLGLPGSVMQIWFQAYGHVVQLRPLNDPEPGQPAMEFLVQMSCVEEALNAAKGLHGKVIMKGRPLVLENWHDPDEVKVKTGINSQKLLEACRLATAKRKEAQQEQPTAEELLRHAGAYPPSAPAAAVEPAGCDSWEELPQDGAALVDDEPEEWEALEPCSCIRMTGAPPGLPEMVMRFWFQPYGQVVDLKPLEGEAGSFLVQMSSEDEATTAVNALHGKPIMKGRPLSLEYWHKGWR
ncbi:unnamed protein product [Polarella glacialis]|uniref:RRM domain-containing protein n=1 Tax=Polarella glacialis TaxID=89957 RepID=A0A813ER32_POLGL|nr:unnamed protein product [Polarella glacialis]